MSCPVPEQIRQDIKRIERVSKANETNARIVQPGVIEFYANMKYNTRNALYGQAMNSIKRVKEWGNNKYGKEFQDHWVETMYQSGNDYVRVAFQFPSRLEKALLIEQDELSIAEANAQILKEIGTDFFMGDTQLAEQEQRELQELDTVTNEELDLLRKQKPEC
jgi:hypothetical protein